MPTISQLPSAADVTAADAIPVSQEGATRSVSVGTLLASMQPAIITDTSTLLGRVSLGSGGPEQVAIGAGLLLNDGTLSASNSTSYGITSLAPVTAIAGNDLVAISQDGKDHVIRYEHLLDGLTIDLAQPALPTTDSDSLWVAQGTSTMLRQTFAAVWSWLMSKQPSYKIPVVEITTNTTLDGMLHNGRILICSQPVTLAPAPVNMGNGFHCTIINLSAGAVTFGTGIATSSGTSELLSGQSASLSCATYSGGTVIFAATSGNASGGTPQVAPGAVTNLSSSNPTTSSVTLSWSAPGTGGTASSYTIQYRLGGTTTWSTFTTGLTSQNVQVTGLAAATTYDFQVFAVNGGGSGPPSSAVSATTAAVAGNVTSITWNMVPSGSYVHDSGSIGVNAQIEPASAAVQFGFSTSASTPPSSWTEATHVNTNLWGAYVSTPATVGTWYAWAEGTDGSKPTVYATPFTVT